MIEIYNLAQNTKVINFDNMVLECLHIFFKDFYIDDRPISEVSLIKFLGGYFSPKSRF